MTDTFVLHSSGDYRQPSAVPNCEIMVPKVFNVSRQLFSDHTHFESCKPWLVFLALRRLSCFYHQYNTCQLSCSCRIWKVRTIIHIGLKAPGSATFVSSYAYHGLIGLNDGVVSALPQSLTPHRTPIPFKHVLVGARMCMRLQLVLVLQLKLPRNLSFPKLRVRSLHG